jgi:ribosomal RNA-processing protein 12
MTSTATAANVRKVACCAALIETAKEQRSGGSSSSEGPVTPNEMFIVAIAALTSLQMKLEDEQKSISSSSNNNDGKNNKYDDFNAGNANDARGIMESIGHDIENTAIPVLELLRRILPYVAHPTNNSGILLLHQFGTLSRMLRMFVVLGYALPSSSVGGGEGDGSLQQQQQRKNSKKKGGKRGGGGGGVHFEGLKESSKNTTEVTTFGANALLRQILKVTTTLLLVTPPIDGGSSSSSSKLVSEKDLAKLLHSTLVPMFHDVRPKVRKAAWGCGMEIIIVVATATASPSSSSLSSSIILNNENDNKPAVTATYDCNNIDKRVQHQRRVVADFLWEYCHAVMTNYHHHQLDDNKKKSSTKMKKNINNEVSSKLIHVLRFLSTALPYADDSRIRIRFGECCLETMMINSSSSSSNTGSGSGGVNAVSYSSVEIVKATLIVLLSCLEMTDREQELVDDDYAKTTTQSVDEGSGRSCIFDGDYDEAMSKFASQCLAFLLQYRPNNGADSSHVGGVNGDDVNTVYGRCLMACMGRMLGKTLSDDTNGSGARDDNDNNAKDVPASKLLAIKLIPNVLTSMLNICELTSSGGSNDDQYDLCGAAFNQFVSNTIPVVVSYLKKKERTNDKIHRMTLEMLALCIPIVQRALQIQYRSAWGSILSGGYATFTLTLARHLLLEQRGFVSGSSDGNVETSDLYCQLSSWVQTLVLSLLRLHDDVAKGGGPARTAVEYATSTIIRGMGIELFLGTVDFVYEDDYGDGVGDTRKKSLSSSSTTGGGIRDDRAWLLPLMKQSTSSKFGKSTWLVGNDDITSRTHLSFFQGNVLSLARKCDAASADGHRTVAESSIQKARVVELWSLFPLFCVHPLDMKESFGNVAKTVVKALGDHGRYPKLVVSTMSLFIYCAYEVYPILTALLVCFL